MACPNCGSSDVWDDNLHWGCNKCDWCSLAGLNPTRTPSAPHTHEPDHTEAERRASDWARKDAHDQAGTGERESADQGCPFSLRHAVLLAPHASAPSRPRGDAAAVATPSNPEAFVCEVCGDTGTWFGKVCVCKQTDSIGRDAE